ncbi:M23 family metallopeptidase [Acidobacteriota bacterium]
MKKKHLSIMIVPHHGGKQKTLTLSKKNIRFISTTILALVLVIGFLLADYFSMDVTRKEYRELQAATQNQNETLAEYKKQIDVLTTNLASMEQFVKKLNVMAGLKEDEPIRMVNGPGAGSGPEGSQSIAPVVSAQNMGIGQLETLQRKAGLVENNLSTLMAHYEADEKRLASTPSIWPTKGYLSSPYGYRDDPFTGKRTMHWGLDVATNMGNPVWATADGRVISRSYDKIGGNIIKIAHGGGVTTMFCHLSKYEAKVGQRIKRGQVIGYVGKTGKAKGPHVHYEVRVNGVRKNPYYYILEES